MTPSACAPPSCSIFGPRPASQISVDGSAYPRVALVSVTVSPSKLTGSPLNRARQASKVSRTARKGCDRSVPSGPSVRLPPAPRPRNARPLESSWMLAIAAAVVAGWRV
jgi:hypothetical protein